MILIMEDTIQTFIETELLGPGAAGSLTVTDELLMSEMIDSMGAVRLIAFLTPMFLRSILLVLIFSSTH